MIQKTLPRGDGRICSRTADKPNPPSFRSPTLPSHRHLWQTPSHSGVEDHRADTSTVLRHPTMSYVHRGMASWLVTLLPLLPTRVNSLFDAEAKMCFLKMHNPLIHPHPTSSRALLPASSQDGSQRPHRDHVPCPVPLARSCSFSLA